MCCILTRPDNLSITSQGNQAPNLLSFLSKKELIQHGGKYVSHRNEEFRIVQTRVMILIVFKTIMFNYVKSQIS